MYPLTGVGCRKFLGSAVRGPDIFLDPDMQEANAFKAIRSGTSHAPNHAEARGVESDEDLIQELRMVLKELNETEVWRQVLGGAAIGCPRQPARHLMRLTAL